MYYFDNAASTKVLKEAAKAALEVMTKFYGNASSIHSFGLQSEKILNSARETICDFLFCEKEEIIFTSGATESINLAIIGSAKKQHNKKKILTSSIEHSATKSCLKILKEKNFKIIEITSKNNRFYAEDFVKEVDDDCFLVSVMHVNNENGLILPVEEIARKVKEKNNDVLVHVDAAQSFLKIPINLKYIDLLSFSGHKVNAPKGVGALFKKKDVKIVPLFFGGGQEQNIRPGTEATALIKAFDVAIKNSMFKMKENYSNYENLKKILVENLKISGGVKFNFNEGSVPYIVNVSVNGIKSQVLLQYLEKEGFIVSSGAACSKNKKNKVLLNLGYGEKEQDEAIRISFSCENDEESVVKLAKKILNAEKILLKK